MIRKIFKQANNGKRVFYRYIKLNPKEMLIILPSSTNDIVKEWTLNHIREVVEKKDFQNAVIVSDEEYELSDSDLLGVRSIKLSIDEIMDVIQYLSFEKKTLGTFYDKRIFVVSFDGEVGNYELRGLYNAGYFEIDSIIKKWIFDYDGELE